MRFYWRSLFDSYGLGVLIGVLNELISHVGFNPHPPTMIVVLSPRTVQFDAQYTA